jgi:hypothetical protein
MDLNPPDERHHLAPSGRRHTQIQFTSAEALFDYALSYRKHEERVADAIRRLLRDPLRCAVLPEAEAVRLTLSALEALLDRLDDGRRICLCDAMGDLYTAILELEKAGVTVQNIDELFEALRVALNGARNKAQLLRQFLHDPKRCALFPLHGNELSLPADLESRLIVGNEGTLVGSCSHPFDADELCHSLKETVPDDNEEERGDSGKDEGDGRADASSGTRHVAQLHLFLLLAHLLFQPNNVFNAVGPSPSPPRSEQPPSTQGPWCGGSHRARFISPSHSRFRTSLLSTRCARVFVMSW